MKTTIFVTRAIPSIAIDMLRAKGYEVDINPLDMVLTQQQLIEALKQKSYDIVLSLLTDHIDAQVYDAAPSVKLYANYATGYDNIDIDTAKARGISITNAPADASVEAVAEFTMALVFALARRVVEADTFVRRGIFDGWAPMHFIGTDLSGKVMALVGMGRIGRRVARIASAMGMQVIYTDVHRDESVEGELAVKYVASIEELLGVADVVSLHVPLLPSTRHLITTDRLKLMKPTALLINTSRGAVIDEGALADALRDGVIGGAALDVFEYEPRLTTLLIKSPRCIVTPHIASATVTARDQMAVVAAQNIIAFVEGETPLNSITH